MVLVYGLTFLRTKLSYVNYFVPFLYLGVHFMTTTFDQINPTKARGENWILKKFHQFLKHKLSTRIKRMIFLSSLLGFTRSKDLPSIDTIIKINEVLGLAHDVDAIKLPIFIREWVWNHEFQEDILVSNRRIKLSQFYDLELSKNELERLVDYIISKTPDWLVYASRDIVSYDLKSLYMCTQS